MKQESFDTAFQIKDPEVFAENMARVAQKSTELLARFVELGTRDSGPIPQGSGGDLTSVSRAFFEIATHYMTQPALVLQAQIDLWRHHSDLWHNTWKKAFGIETEPVIEPARGDKRFKDEQWQQNQVFDFLKQSYLLTAQWARDIVSQAEDVDPRTRQKADFYVQQIANALAPTNFLMTNPAVLRETAASNAENLVHGLDHLIEDLDRGEGRVAIRQTDLEAFEVGRNLALTPGKVVFQNDLMQLIQYTPTTRTVYRRPLLIVPPWINKFYILDLNPDKSFIRWVVEQGFTVFVISWVNPDGRLALKSFEDYMAEGILAALDAIEQATGEKEANAIGYCIGGTLLAITLAFMAARSDKRIKSATFFTTQVDFTNAGDLMVFVDEEQIRSVEAMMAERGFLEGGKMAEAFNMLRSNDLIWSYVVNNYLLGKEPFPFDLLYWNSDSTRMPAAMHSFYLRRCYLDNTLSAGRMTIGGERIDLSKVRIPVYNLASREDHIAPLPSTFLNGRFLGGPTRLVVAGSGHIAGVINPPAAGKYQHWTNDRSRARTLESWLATATETPGSWWPDWKAWLAKRSGKQVPARMPGAGGLEPIEDAPGSYVKVRSDTRKPARP